MLPWTAIPTRRLPRRAYVDMNGSSEELRNATNNAIGIVNAWSIMFVCKPLRSSFTATENIIAIRASGNNNSFIEITIEGGVANDPLRIICRTSGGTVFKQLDWNSYFATGVGVHTIVTFDGAASGDPLLVYQNGVNVAHSSGTDNTGTMTDTSRRVSIGCDTAGAGHWQGQIGDVAIWDVALSAAECAYLYKERRSVRLLKNEGPYVNAGNLEHHWQWLDTSDIGKDTGLAASGAIDVDGDSGEDTSAGVLTYLV
jgi:hypothetical protein